MSLSKEFHGAPCLSSEALELTLAFTSVRRTMSSQESGSQIPGPQVLISPTEIGLFLIDWIDGRSSLQALDYKDNQLHSR